MPATSPEDTNISYSIMNWSKRFCILFFLPAAAGFVGTPALSRANGLSNLVRINSKCVSCPPLALQETAVSVEGSDHRERRRSVAAILTASFLNLLGFTMAGPMTPALGRHFNLDVGISFGSLTSAYPFGMLFGLFLWPRLSDNVGRKPIMTMSLVGSGLGLVLQSLVIRSNASLWCFLAARALTGTFAGSSPVSKAYLADVGNKDGNLPRYLALRDAASTMAFIVGPVLGGIIYDIRKRASGVSESAVLCTAASLSFTIAISAAASLLAAAFVGTLVKDVARTKSKDSQINDEIDEGAEELISCPLGRSMWSGVASVCLVSFLFNIGDSTFHAFFSTLLRDGAGLGTKGIGILSTLLACISFTVSTTGTSWILKTFGPVAACAVGLGFTGSGLLAFGAAAWPGITILQPRLAVLAAAAALYYCGVPLYGPSVPTMLLRCVPSSKRGAIMGLDGAVNTVGRIISPLMMGEIYRRFGAGAAFGLAGSLVLLGMGTALFRRFIVLRDP
jgi:DHA1 family tetracycline resistance protein-like MFS transporter